MPLKIVFIIVCLRLNVFLSVAQIIVPQRDNEYDKKYTPAQNSVFSNLNKKNDRPSQFGISIKNAVKLNPTLLSRQKIGFYYERAVYKGISMYAGVGKAFGNDIWQQIAFTIKSGFRTSGILSPSDALNYSEYAGSSALLSVGAKVYLSGEVFGDTFISFNYMHEQLDFRLNEIIYDRPVQGSREVSFVMNAFSCGFGYIFLGGAKENVIHEIYFNVGGKLFDISKFERVDFNPPVGSSVGYYRKSSGVLEANITPAVSIGYIIGVGF